MGIVRQTQQTVFMITHDVDEAILLADRILLMSNGCDTPEGWRPGGNALAEVVCNPLPRSARAACTTSTATTSCATTSSTSWSAAPAH
jgi:nitrate/nitrite transport system ATP-binding protein